MKNLTLLLLTAVAGLSACRKEITQVTQVKQVDQAFAAVYDIKSEDWITQDDSLSFYASFDIPELSDNIFDHGAVIIYLSFDDNIYEALPEVFQGIAYGVVHSPGTATVDIHALDGNKIAPPTEEVYAKIVLIDAQQLSLHPGTDLQDYNRVKSTFHLK